jgi:hypothetical protein
MSWITVVWSMNAAACLTLAGFYCVVWCKQRENWVYLLFSSSAVAVRISVTDRGGGIPKQKLEQVFERFFTTKEEGMGLGLSICRTIINEHRRKIWATNSAHCGATFHFSLPIVSLDAFSAAPSEVLDRLSLTATDASAPRVTAPSVLLRSAATGSEAEELRVSASSVLLERSQ